MNHPELITRLTSRFVIGKECTELRERQNPLTAYLPEQAITKISLPRSTLRESTQQRIDSERPLDESLLHPRQSINHSSLQCRWRSYNEKPYGRINTITMNQGRHQGHLKGIPIGL